MIYQNISNIPFFSIIITTYNRQEFLARAISSVQSQNMVSNYAYEIIVCDDASTDDTPSYCKKLGNTIIYHRNTTNLGHSRTVNIGINLARGTWIKFLDDDDFLDKDCLFFFFQATQKYPSAVIISCQARTISPQQKIHFPANSENHMYAISPNNVYPMMLEEQASFGATSKVAVKTDVAKQIGGWDPSLDYAYDEIDFWVRVAEFGVSVFLTRGLVFYTQWVGGNNRKISIYERLQRNILMKQKIYEKIHTYDNVPTLCAVIGYLHLHWGMIALRNLQWCDACTILWPYIFSLAAWKIWGNVHIPWFRKKRMDVFSKYKIV